MELIFHGGAGQVGRSCIEVRTNNTRLLLDAGLWITDKGAEFPTEIENIGEIDAVIISHAHLDHTGALPLFEHLGLRCKVFTNNETKTITKVLLKDSFKISRIQHVHVAYEKMDIEKIISMFEDVGYHETREIKDVKFTLLPAGHIPGSASILIEADGERLLYSGDINSNETKLLKGAETNIENIDYLIVESTYGDREHNKRENEEKEFLNTVENTLKRNGKVLVPAFAVGRAQEILMILGNKFEVPIYVDGMARQICQTFIDYPKFVIDPGKLREMVEKSHFIRGWEERDEIIKKPCIIITTSGMVNGGPVMYYLSKLWKDKNSSILMTGYQAKHTTGKMIFEEGKAFIDGNLVEIVMEIRKFDFSAHSGMSELHNFVLNVKPKKVIVQHGDEDAIHKFASWINEQGIEAFSPKLGEKITIHKD